MATLKAELDAKKNLRSPTSAEAHRARAAQLGTDRVEAVKSRRTAVERETVEAEAAALAAKLSAAKASHAAFLAERRDTAERLGARRVEAAAARRAEARNADAAQLTAKMAHAEQGHLATLASRQSEAERLGQARVDAASARREAAQRETTAAEADALAAKMSHAEQGRIAALVERQTQAERLGQARVQVRVSM